jgi:hypothetical protein
MKDTYIAEMEKTSLQGLPETGSWYLYATVPWRCIFKLGQVSLGCLVSVDQTIQKHRDVNSESVPRFLHDTQKKIDRSKSLILAATF